jgi:hypothetical protein
MGAEPAGDSGSCCTGTRRAGKTKSSTFTCSVVLGAGRLYVTSRSGITMVFRPNPSKFEMLASNDLREPSNATPAISDGKIFIRTDGRFFCIAED